jgi:hypothetical protein
MFERTTEYEAAYVGEFPAFEEHAGPALGWAAQKMQEHKCGLTVVAPTRGHFRDHRTLAELPANVQKETPQTLGYYPKVQPVVVAFWPSAKDLERLDGAQGLKALAVVPWQEDDIATWCQARGAVDLLGRRPVPEAPTISDPVVAVAMRSLTRMVNLSTGVGHPRDRSMAIHAFRILERNGHEYDPTEIGAWAMANGWAADDARDLSEYAAGVLAGKAYRAGPSGWNRQIIRIWRKDAARGGEEAR